VPSPLLNPGDPLIQLSILVHGPMELPRDMTDEMLTLLETNSKRDFLENIEDPMAIINLNPLSGASLTQPELDRVIKILDESLSDRIRRPNVVPAYFNTLGFI